VTASPPPVENETNSLTFSVTALEAGERLDAFLATRIEGWSRARLQRLIEDAAVLVNGNVSKSSYRLHPDDEIEVELTPSLGLTFTPEDIPLEIVHEDEALIVVNKPAGIVVHPAAGVASGTLANALAFHFQQLAAGGGKYRPGIVHRLDKGTSGLLVVAKTERAHEDLVDQFRAREVFKSYVVLVHGQVEKSSGEVDQPIARDPRHRTRMAVVRGGRPALSTYRIRKQFSRFTLLDVELKTGRTHQIRVHLSWMKHPVVGDEVYGSGRDKTVSDPLLRTEIARLNRQFLHAEKLGFRHPVTQEQIRFAAPIPAVLLNILEKIQSSQHLDSR
jgi:23S rRNA pseudouridine1911/1915/1917 synthase